MLEHAVAMSDSPSSTKCKEFFATVYEVVIGICPSEDLKKEPGFRKMFFFLPFNFYMFIQVELNFIKNTFDPCVVLGSKWPILK